MSQDAFENDGSQPMDRTGDFRGNIIDYYGVEGRGGSVNVAIRVHATGIWDDENQQWDDTWEQYQMVAEGLVCVVRKDKQLNETGVRGLVDCAGWDASMTSIFNHTWEPKPIAFTVEEDDYKGRKSFKIGFINPYDSTPGGRGNMTEDKAKAFDSQYGAQLRALVGNTARNASTAAPKGKPTAPKAGGPRKASPKAAPKTAPGGQEEERQPGQDGIPF